MDILRLQVLIVAAITACEGGGKEIIHHYHHYEMISCQNDEAALYIKGIIQILHSRDLFGFL